MVKCAVKNCGRTWEKNPECMFHRFPVDPIIRSCWIQFTRNGWQIKDGSRMCSAHFAEEEYYPDENGNKIKKNDAVPTIRATLEPDSDDEDFYGAVLSRSLPLYSSPALADHHYAVLVPRDLRSADPQSDGDCESMLDEAEHPPVLSAPLDSSARQGAARLRNAAANATPPSSQAQRLSHARCFKMLAFWKTKARKWKKDALAWKAKCQEHDAEKNNSTTKCLKKLFRGDQLALLSGRVKKVRKWTNETIVEGLKVHFACGRGYETVRQLPYVALPAYQTLMERIKVVHFDTGVLHEVVDFMSYKVPAMDEIEKDCGMYIDEVSIDESEELCSNNKKYFGKTTLPPTDNLATHAIVFMLGGLKTRWKQVIAYDFTGNSIPKNCLKERILEVLAAVEKIGLRVHFITFDCGPANKTMMNDFGISTRKESLHEDKSLIHPIDDNRFLELIPDPVHIFKNCVQGWIANHVIVVPEWYMQLRKLSSPVVDREHLTHLVASEEDQDLKMAYRLSAADVDFEHLKASGTEKMKVKNSTKYCCYHVGSALEVLSDQQNNSSLKTTAAFVLDVSKWYELMTINSTEEPLTPKNTAPVEHFMLMIRLFTEIKVGKDGHWKPWQAAAVMCTKAILRLQTSLFERFNFTELFTAWVNQNCLENLFSVVRLKQKRPTAVQFRNHLRTICLSQYMKDVAGSSYDHDESAYLTGFIEHLDSVRTVETREKAAANLVSSFVTSSIVVDVTERATEILLLDKSEANVLFHVAGYILGSIGKRMKTCGNCYKKCVTKAPFDKTYGKYSSFLARARGKPFVFVSKEIFELFVCMETDWKEQFKKGIDKEALEELAHRLEEYDINLPNCHNLKRKIINRYVQFRSRTNRLKKIRKRKYDSASMLN